MLIKKIAIHLAVLAAMSAVTAVQAEVYVATVTRVLDGDTVYIDAGDRKHVRIRLKGVDAPEKDQTKGDLAKEVLTQMVLGKEVLVNSFGKDKYGREVAQIGCDGQDAGAEMLSLGLVWAYRSFLGDLDDDWREEYLKREDRAKHFRLGIWEDSDPIPPWTWRKMARDKDRGTKFHESDQISVTVGQAASLVSLRFSELTAALRGNQADDEAQYDDEAPQKKSFMAALSGLGEAVSQLIAAALTLRWF